MTERTWDIHNEADVAELATWYEEVARCDIEMALSKMRQYGGQNGSADFEMIAKGFQLMNPELTDMLALEMAVGFYLMGKVARMFAGYAHGNPPTMDTLIDASIYTMILRRIRAKGSWG